MYPPLKKLPHKKSIGATTIKKWQKEALTVKSVQNQYLC